MKRRSFLKNVWWGSLALTVPQLPFCKTAPSGMPRSKPNIIFILADDLGYGELGCYGQKKIRTPSLDRLAAEGMLFTQHYCGSPVCAPSRCVLLTGKHTGHAYIRDNDEMPERGDVWRDPELEGQRPLLSLTQTMGTLLQQAGYTTGAMGKWGLGGPESSGAPNAQGFDQWFGYLCQRVAHNYYPTHLWRNREKVLLKGNPHIYAHQKFPKDRDPHDPASYASYAGSQYSMDLMAEEALRFIRENRGNPFFLYLPFPVPHVAIQVPEDSLHEYEGAFPETPYWGEKGYLPHPKPRAGYAAMITRMDREIGRIMALLRELGIDRNTLVLFSSDNGPTWAGGADTKFFESAGNLRGGKANLYEGGIRVPLVARWPGTIEAGSKTEQVCAFWDLLPTFANLAGIAPPPDTDGLSFHPTLLGNPDDQKKHEYLYWEYKGRQAVRFGEWKGHRRKAGKNTELYHLKEDVGEKQNVAKKHPEVVRRIEEIMKTARVESELFPLVR